MAPWFRSVLGVLVFANVAGVASVAVWWLPGPPVSWERRWTPASPPDGRDVLPFALGLGLVVVAEFCARRATGRPSRERTPTPRSSDTPEVTTAGQADHIFGASGWTLAANVAVVLGTVLTSSGLVSVSTVAGMSANGGSSENRHSGSVVILAVNDVYRIEGIEAGKAGGIARLRTLRAELERAYPGRVLLLHGGDVIFPSFLSRTYKGEQMIDVLNLMDGDPQVGRLDERMFVVFGNHEFDEEACGSDSSLQQRVAQADFYWLHSNIGLNPCPDRRPRLVGANLLHSKIVEIGGLRVGLFGLTIDTKHDSFRFMDARETARALTRDLRKRGADVVVAVTHLNWRDDLRLYEELRRDGLDLVIGGHDHVTMSLPKAEPRIFKADADAVTAWVVALTRHADGRIQVAGRRRELREGMAKDPLVDRQVAGWMQRHATEFCQAAQKDRGWIGARPVSATCLDERLGVTETTLTGSEERIRSSETSLGNWIADQMFTAFKECGADGAFINAGGLRLNQDLAKDSEITMRHLEELIQYPTTLRIYKLTHARFRKALENAISEPGAGRWLQVSEQIAFTYRPGDQEGAAPARLVKAVIRPATKPPIEVTESSTGDIRIVANEYLQKNTTDGFDTILPPPDETACAASGSDLKKILYSALKSQGRIKPEEQGRICTDAEARRGGCRVDQLGTTR